MIAPKWMPADTGNPEKQIELEVDKPQTRPRPTGITAAASVER